MNVVTVDKKTLVLALSAALLAPAVACAAQAPAVRTVHFGDN